MNFFIQFCSFLFLVNTSSYVWGISLENIGPKTESAVAPQTNGTAITLNITRVVNLSAFALANVPNKINLDSGAFGCSYNLGAPSRICNGNISTFTDSLGQLLMNTPQGHFNISGTDQAGKPLDGLIITILMRSISSYDHSSGEGIITAKKIGYNDAVICLFDYYHFYNREPPDPNSSCKYKQNIFD